jgi:hypothetical protein
MRTLAVSRPSSALHVERPRQRVDAAFENGVARELTVRPDASTVHDAA